MFSTSEGASLFNSLESPGTPSIIISGSPPFIEPNPRILILDDSTSSVDLATEAQIQNALDELMKGRTSFVIAQRISTVMNADLILILEKGQIAAWGNHTELLETSEIYAEIYSSQLISDSDLIESDFIGG